MDHFFLSLMPNFLCGLIICLTWGNGKIHMDGLAAGQALVAGGLWKPMHLQPVFAGYEAILPRPLPAREGRSVTEALFRDGLCLPSGTAMSAADLARVVEVIRHAR